MVLLFDELKWLPDQLNFDHKEPLRVNDIELGDLKANNPEMLHLAASNRSYLHHIDN